MTEDRDGVKQPPPDLVVLGPGVDRDEVRRRKQVLPRGVRLVQVKSLTEEDLAGLLATTRSYLDLPAELDGNSCPAEWLRLYELVREGLTSKEVAGVRVIAVSTVGYRFNKMLKVHGARNRRELVRIVSRDGLRPPRGRSGDDRAPGSAVN